MKSLKLLMPTLAICALLSSCGTPIKYLDGVETLTKSELSQVNPPKEPTAMVGDLLQITVTSRLPEAAKPYNKAAYISESGVSNTDATEQGYLVDSNGEIEFPVIGALYVKGLTKAEIKDLVISKLYPNHLVEKPSVEVRFKNFRITILGEVKNPGIVEVPNERINILEAIAEAGDMTVYGLRDKVRVIRTEADGTRSVHTLDVGDKNVIFSPYFNLQQNDVVYVEPNGTKKRSNFAIPPAATIITSLASLGVAIVTMINVL